jgi:hypothetical protein
MTMGSSHGRWSSAVAGGFGSICRGLNVPGTVSLGDAQATTATESLNV